MKVFAASRTVGADISTTVGLGSDFLLENFANCSSCTLQYIDLDVSVSLEAATKSTAPILKYLLLKSFKLSGVYKNRNQGSFISFTKIRAPIYWLLYIIFF